MKRVMVNLEDSVGELLDQKAKREKRSASGYVALLIENDLKSVEIDTRERLMAAAEEVGLDVALRALSGLRRPSRRKGVAA